MPTLAAWLAFVTSASAYLYVQEQGITGVPRGIKLGPALAMAAMVAQRWPWFSLVFFLWALGDAFLLDKKRYFLHGLGSFLAGHIVLASLCLSTFHRGASALGLGIGLLVSGGMLVILWPGLRAALRVAVPVYTLGLTAALATLSPLGWQGTLGCLVFLVSDALIGFQRFRQPVPHGERWVWTTYVAALALIADALLRALPLENVAS